MLADVPNLAVDAALVEALPNLEPEVQPAALDLLIERGRESGLLGLVAGFEGFAPALQDLVLARVNELYTAARLGVSSDQLEVRLNAIELIRRSGKAKLAYLLAEAVCQACPKTRAAAAEGLRDATARHLEQRSSASGEGCCPAQIEEDGDYLARALHRALDGWDLHFRLEVLIAAMWMADRLEHVLLARADESRSHFALALLEQLAAPDDARLAGFAWRALRSPALRSTAAKRIAACQHPDFIRGLIAESWLLADPQIARECPRIRRWVWLQGDDHVLMSLPPEQAVGVVRLIASSGLSLDHKAALYERLLSSNSEAVQRAAFWRWAAAETPSAEAVLRGLAQRDEGPLAGPARREIARRDRARRHLHEHSSDGQGDSPTHPFDVYWRRFDEADESARQEDGNELARKHPDLLIRLRAKLASGQTADRTRALKITRALDLTDRLDERIYRLTSDPDSVVRSQAVAMLADLEGPTARRIARRSLNDPDPRVQANAIEVLDSLAVDGKQEQLEPKLDSRHQRVRATAIAALLRMQASDAAEALLDMLSDPSSAHRISALWVVEHLGLASMLHRLEEMAETDPDIRVRRRAGRVRSSLPAWFTPLGATAGDEEGL